MVSQTQFDKIQGLIEAGIKEGADSGDRRRWAGPTGLNRGYYVRPTVFADVKPEMRIAREEIFGPVLSIMPYDSEEQVIRLANDTPYGLAAYVQARQSRAGPRKSQRRCAPAVVQINYPAWDSGAPFGGYKQSGNGREYAEFGLEDFLEVKGMVGYGAA